MAVDAQTTVNGQSASFVTGSSDFRALDTNGIKIRAEAWRGRWGITADNTLTNFSAESRIDQANTVKLSGHDYSTELGGSYIVGEHRFTPDTAVLLEAMAGGRLVALKQELEFSSGINESDRKRFVDPYVGARFTWIISPFLSFDVRGNVAGFGIGSGSESAWMVSPELNYFLSKSAIINFAYRHYYEKTENETGDTPTQFNGHIFGAALGLEIRFGDVK